MKNTQIRTVLELHDALSSLAKTHTHLHVGLAKRTYSLFTPTFHLLRLSNEQNG